MVERAAVHRMPARVRTAVTHDSQMSLLGESDYRRRMMESDDAVHQACMSWLAFPAFVVLVILLASLLQAEAAAAASVHLMPPAFYACHWAWACARVADRLD